MNVLVIGSGGREHAIAWKLAQSPDVTSLWAAPGNPGTALVAQNEPVGVEDVAGLVRLAREKQIDLVIIGPEAALAAGVGDALAEAGIAVFGPSRAAARIETSKAFAKQFMQRHDIPTARFAIFDRLEPALAHLDMVDTPVVIKASGLAAGKGVLLPESREEAREALKSLLVEKRFGEAGDEVIIEERLAGEELSVLAFSDGLTLAVMLPAQDHKRALDGDRGPNTGGMGAICPAPDCSPELLTRITRTVLEPAIAGMRSEGTPFAGILYAGLILTSQGPQVLEFNARFGDPETQAILPLLESDLLEVCLACSRQELAGTAVNWKKGAAACVVLASADYPEKSSPAAAISGLDALPEGVLAFQAGTGMREGQLMATGGRVLGITGVGEDLGKAIERAYQGVEAVKYEGMKYRRDIGRKGGSYRKAGVDIDAGNRAVALMRKEVESTYDKRVLAGIGAFGGLFDASGLVGMRKPVLVASTDGIGTKVKLAAGLGRVRNLGTDIVNHCINDILVQGARPLFFLDYFAASKLQPELVAEIVAGMAEACREAGCALLGGETAEMPGVYQSGEFDVAGTIIGCVEMDLVLPKKTIEAGDLLVGWQSNGPHTNGFSLLRQIFEGVDLEQTLPGSEMSLADGLLAPHRSYLRLLQRLVEDPNSPLKALAHITGGGFIENIPRVLPKGLGAVIETGAWKVPALFELAQERGGIEREEMYRVFNMGIGMVGVVSPEEDKLTALRGAGLVLQEQETVVIGRVVEDERHGVRLA